MDLRIELKLDVQQNFLAIFCDFFLLFALPALFDFIIWHLKRYGACKLSRAGITQ